MALVVARPALRSRGPSAYRQILTSFGRLSACPSGRSARTVTLGRHAAASVAANALVLAVVPRALSRTEGAGRIEGAAAEAH
ncbi:hypothetical protein HMPREF9440_00821 [Sutterella parvirubra YIT 11816]|uniref:Uncharacterized protein n=1 Tax=Sutterella parvirubra YIT 11816 TaxID=762967 RepID=H3KDL2_9BURK|nr:hypothetical protein HMPREF9440_00821 [Sutterella parvirubra YIT 11816]